MRHTLGGIVVFGGLLLWVGPLYGPLRDFCTRCPAWAGRIAVLGARSAPKDTVLTSRGALPGDIKGQSPSAG